MKWAKWLQSYRGSSFYIEWMKGTLLYDSFLAMEDGAIVEHECKIVWYNTYNENDVLQTYVRIKAII